MTVAIVEETVTLEGEIMAPSSKSYTHRAIIASSLADGVSWVKNPLYAEDTIATINACASFGVSIIQHDTELQITGSQKLRAPHNIINCGDSGSTIRFLTPIAALAKGKTVLDGDVSLRKRPVGPLIEALWKLNVQCSSNNGFPPVTVFGGGLRGGKTSLVGDISSQFITGLLLACPLAEEYTEIFLKTPLESKPYVKLTLNILRQHGIEMDSSKSFRRFSIPSNQRYSPRDHKVPGDFSAAAFLLAAATITNSDVTVNNLSFDHPDHEIIKILNRMGAATKVIKNSVRVSSSKLKGITINAKDIPDLVPICTVLGCFCDGITYIYGAKRLRLKESDRLSALSSEFRKMGADVVEKADGLVINGPCKLKGTTINPHNDHRIAMACTIASLKAKGKTEILDAECVNKSYPNFFKDLKILGAKIYVR